MDDQEFLHNLSVTTNVNIEVLKDLNQDEKFLALVRKKKSIDATLYIRSLNNRLSLGEAKMVAEGFLEKPW